MENIRFTTELDDIVECDLVIENITEDIEKKKCTIHTDEYDLRRVDGVWC